MNGFPGTTTHPVGLAPQVRQPSELAHAYAPQGFRRGGAALSAALNAAWAPPASALVQCGMASWYDEAAGTQAADGGKVDPSVLAAAHRFLPFGTRVRVENLANGRATTVAINDRGPFVAGRLIDVTRAVAERSRSSTVA